MTIVEYTDRRAPKNAYPAEIISPTHDSPCCWPPGAMQLLGYPEQQGRYTVRYLRCPTCGYTVRRVTEMAPDLVLEGELRRSLQAVFSRKDYDWQAGRAA